jgi:hypothetical protein
MARERKTVDVWEFWLNHTGAWECETVELTRDLMRTNLKAYREAGFSPTIRKRRVRRELVASYEPKWRS